MAVVAAGAVIGGVVGGWMLKRINEKLLRGFVVVIGAALDDRPIPAQGVTPPDRARKI